MPLITPEQAQESRKCKVGGQWYPFSMNPHRIYIDIGPYHTLRSSIWSLRLDGWLMTRWTDGKPFSELRQKNLKEAFDWITWDFSSVLIVRRGGGDRTLYAVPGELKAFPVYVAYRSGGLAGLEPRMHFFMNGKKVFRASKTSQVHSVEVKQMVYAALVKLMCPWHPYFGKVHEFQEAWERWKAYMIGLKERGLSDGL